MQRSLDPTRHRLDSLVRVFERAMDARAPGAKGADMPQAQVAQILHHHSTCRVEFLCAEINALIDYVPLTHERISYSLRYRQPIFADDVTCAEQCIRQDLVDSADAGTAASHLLEVAEMQDHDLDRGSFTSRLYPLIDEHTRLVNGILSGPMTADQVITFHAAHPAPDHPAMAFYDVSARMADGLVRIVEAGIDRIEHTMEYINHIDTAVLNAFPEHADGMRQQSDSMVRECYYSIARAQTIIDRVPAVQNPVPLP